MTALVTFFLEMLGVAHKSNIMQVYYDNVKQNS